MKVSEHFSEKEKAYSNYLVDQAEAYKRQMMEASYKEREEEARRIYHALLNPDRMSVVARSISGKSISIPFEAVLPYLNERLGILKHSLKVLEDYAPKEPEAFIAPLP